jgi:hypothetical protein
MPRNVIFVAPFPLETTMRFVRAVARLHDVRLFGVVHEAPSGDDARCYDDVVRVSDPLSASDIQEAVALLAKRHGAPHRILAVLPAVASWRGQLTVAVAGLLSIGVAAMTLLRVLPT